MGTSRTTAPKISFVLASLYLFASSTIIVGGASDVLGGDAGTIMLDRCQRAGRW